MEKVLVKNPDVIWRKIEDKIVIITGDAQAVHVLNKTAAFIWGLCDGTMGINQIVENVCEQFDVSAEAAKTDVVDTLRKFDEMGLLETDTDKKSE